MLGDEKIRLRCSACGVTLMGKPKQDGAVLTCPTCKASARFEAVMPVRRPGGASVPPAPAPAAREDGGAPAGAPDVSSTCPKCGGTMEPGSASCVACGQSAMRGTPAAVSAATPAAELGKGGPRPDLSGRFAMALAVGGVAAAACGIVWALIAVQTGYEVGYVAWGVGLATGFAVTRVTPERSPKVGAAAAGLAVAGILIGKIFIVQWAAVPAIAKEQVKNREVMLAAILDDMAQKGEVDAEVAAWIRADNKDNEPPEALQKKLIQAAAGAEKRLSKMSREEKLALATPWAERAVASIGLVDRLKATVSPIDILWLFLAVGTSWKMGSKGGG